MDHSCDPGLHRLAQVLMKDLDLDLNKVPVAEPQAALPLDETATVFKGATFGVVFNTEHRGG